jgi:hypothetical protein
MTRHNPLEPPFPHLPNPLLETLRILLRERLPQQKPLQKPRRTSPRIPPLPNEQHREEARGRGHPGARVLFRGRRVEEQICLDERPFELIEENGLVAWMRGDVSHGEGVEEVSPDTAVLHTSSQVRHGGGSKHKIEPYILIPLPGTLLAQAFRP